MSSVCVQLNSELELLEHHGHYHQVRHLTYSTNQELLEHLTYQSTTYWKSTELINEDCSSSSIGYLDANIQKADDRGPSSHCPDTGGSRPTCGVKSINIQGEESECQLYEISGCEVYPGHIARHFRELLNQDFTKEKELMGLTSLGHLLCPRCVFSGSSQPEVLDHIGHYPQVLDHYFQAARDSSTLNRLCAGGSRVELSQGRECGK